MKRQTMPAPRRAGTTRSERELRVVERLEEIARTNPARFEQLMKLLAELMVSEPAKKK